MSYFTVEISVKNYSNKYKYKNVVSINQIGNDFVVTSINPYSMFYDTVKFSSDIIKKVNMVVQHDIIYTSDESD